MALSNWVVGIVLIVVFVLFMILFMLLARKHAEELSGRKTKEMKRFDKLKKTY